MEEKQDMEERQDLALIIVSAIYSLSSEYIFRLSSKYFMAERMVRFSLCDIFTVV